MRIKHVSMQTYEPNLLIKLQGKWANLYMSWVKWVAMSWVKMDGSHIITRLPISKFMTIY